MNVAVAVPTRESALTLNFHDPISEFSTQRVTERLEGVCTIAAELFDVAVTALIFYTEGCGWEVLSAGRLSHLPIPKEASASFHAIASGKPLIVPDTHCSTTHGQYRGVEPAWQMRFFAAMPLDIDGGMGALCLLDRRPRNLGGRHRHLLEEMAQLCNSIMSRIQQKAA